MFSVTLCFTGVRLRRVRSLSTTDLLLISGMCSVGLAAGKALDGFNQRPSLGDWMFSES